MIDRRNLLKGVTAGVGATFGSSIVPDIAHAASVTPGLTCTGGLKRVIFSGEGQNLKFPKKISRLELRTQQGMGLVAT